MAIASADFRELRLDRLSRVFGGHHALRQMSLTVRRGEFIALLGPSGCGKSTALNCLAGLLPLSDGAIWLDERRIDALKPEDRGFGMVFQNYALFPHMSVRRNVGFGLAMRGVPRVELDRRVDEALGIVRLGDQGAKLPGQLSGGQQQSASPSPAPSRSNRPSSSWMSRFPTSTPSCGSRCARRSAASTASSALRPSM